MSGSYALSIPDMYSLSSKTYDAFGIDGYDPPKHYHDPAKIMKDRELAKIKKGVRPKGKVPNRGHYLEDLKKMTFGPGPCAYTTMKPLPPIDEKEKKPQSKKNMTISKHSYIDIIYDNAKKRPFPGPGNYNLLKTEEDVKKELQKYKEKPKRNDVKGNFLNDYEFLGSLAPGPGQYNPRKEIRKIRPDPLNPEKWRAKHKEDKKIIRKLPPVGTYDPLPLDNTFERISKENNKKQSNGTGKTHYFGLEERFKDPKKTKSKSYVNLPGPGKYNVLIEWEGKEELSKSGESKKKTVNLSKLITKGIETSIYYEDSFERNASVQSLFN